MNITVAGAGYVGLSISTLLAVKNNVKLVEVWEYKVNEINERKSPIKDSMIEKFFNEYNLNLKATTDASAYKDADFIVIAVPTNYDEQTNYFDTHIIEEVIECAMKLNNKAVFVIKSTIPVGYCETLYKKYEGIKLIFSPEFLRESRALIDNLFPTRIIIGCHKELSFEAAQFAELLYNAAWTKDIPILYMSLTEAEAVKLFANTYLAMRVSYFNELDTYASKYGLDTKNIIDGISLDPRIGKGYNNPSFGYGGYCLPKDTKQLLSNYKEVPQSLIKAIVDSNVIRKKFIVEDILSRNPKVVGIYRLIMKSNSDNFRYAAISDIITQLLVKDVKIVIYEPTIVTTTDLVLDFLNDLEKFKEMSDIIVANRFDSELEDVKDKVYTKDIYHEN